LRLAALGHALAAARRAGCHALWKMAVHQQAEQAAYLTLVDPAFFPDVFRRRATALVSARWFETDSVLQVEDPIGDAATGVVLWPLKDRRTGEVRPCPSQFLLEQLRSFEALAVAAFQSVDTDNSGSIEVEELQRLLQRSFGMAAFSRQVAKVLLVAYDKDGNGNIDRSEFVPLFIRVSTLYKMYEALQRGAANVAVAGGAASMEEQAGAGRGEVGGIKMNMEQLVGILNSLEWGFE